MNKADAIAIEAVTKALAQPKPTRAEQINTRLAEDPRAEAFKYDLFNETGEVDMWDRAGELELASVGPDVIRVEVLSTPLHGSFGRGWHTSHLTRARAARLRDALDMLLAATEPKS